MKHAYKARVIELATFYEKTLTDEQVRVFAQFLSERLTLSELSRAIGLYCENPKNEFFPRPISKLVGLVHEPVDDDALTREAAGRIVTAFGKFGWCNGKDAKEYIGELGWTVVQKQGGWTRLCEASKHMNLEMFQAQARELAKAQLALAKHGRLDTPPGLPRPCNVQVLPTQADKQRALAGMIKDLNEVIK